MKKFIIFDFDGTLADTLPVVLKIFKKVIKEYGYKDVTDKDIESLRSMDALDIVRNFKFPIWKIPKLIKSVRKELAKKIKIVKPFEKIEELLILLKAKGFGLGILTSNNKSTVNEFLTLNNLNYFSDVESNQGIFNKSAYLSRFLKKHNLKNSELVYIGDEVRDIEASREANVDIIAVSWGFNTKEVLQKYNPTFIADRPKDILNYLK